MKATLPITSRGIAARRGQGRRKWLGSVRDEGHAPDHKQGDCCMQGAGTAKCKRWGHAEAGAAKCGGGVSGAIRSCVDPPTPQA